MQFCKIIFTLGLSLLSFSTAIAGELKVSGALFFNIGYHNNTVPEFYQLRKVGASGEDFIDHARIRVGLEYKHDEILSGFFQLQIREYPQLHKSITTARQAYININLPKQKAMLRMGRQEYGLPSLTFLYPVYAEVTESIVFFKQLSDQSDFHSAWLRTGSNIDLEGPGTPSADFFTTVYNKKFNNSKLVLWGNIGRIGRRSVGHEAGHNLGLIGTYNFKNTNGYMMAYWAGISFENRTFDPLRITSDFFYSANNEHGAVARKGWYSALGLFYDTEHALLFSRGWYSSGDKGDEKGSNRYLNMYGLSMFDGSDLVYKGNDLFNVGIGNPSAAGSWGIQTGLQNLSFFDNLKHRIAVTVTKGTNHVERAAKGKNPQFESVILGPGWYLTTSDTVVDTSFYTTYTPYKNLTLHCLLSYATFDLSKKAWGNVYYDDAFRGIFGFTYNF